MLEVVAGVLYREDGAFLACQRPAHKARGLCWEFPGGKQELGETEQECLVRELREELCLVVRPGEKIETVRHDYGGFSVEVAFYRAEALCGEMKLMVHADAVWTQKKELCSYDFLEADIGFVRWLAESK